VVTPAALLAVWPCHAPTPLIDLPRLATRCGVAKVVLKDEGLRPLAASRRSGPTGVTTTSAFASWWCGG